MKAIKLNAVIDDRYELHLKLPEGVKVGPAEVIVMFEEDGVASENSQNLPASEVATQGLRQFGQFKGLIQIADDFDEPLPDTFWLGEN